MTGKRCVDCGGSGYIIWIRWRDYGRMDYPGSHGDAARLGDVDDMIDNWTEPCGLCAGTGWTHYDERGHIEPGLAYSS